MTEQTTSTAPSMQKRVIDTRTAIMRMDLQPNTFTADEAWDVAIETFEDLPESDKGDFKREWYAAINRSQLAEVELNKAKARESGTGRRQRGFDKNGEPTNRARAERMENTVENMWSALIDYAASKGKRVLNKVNKHREEVNAKCQKLDEEDAIERAEKDRKRQERREKKAAEATA